MTFGERLRQMRENAGFSREQVVSMLGDGFSYSSLQKYEDGRRRPPLLKAKQLANLYGTTVSELIGDTLDDELISEAKKIMSDEDSIEALSLIAEWKAAGIGIDEVRQISKLLKTIKDKK